MGLIEFSNKLMKEHNNHVVKFYITETVYVKSDSEQTPRTVIGINLLPHSSVIYSVTENGNVDRYYDFELSSESDDLKKIK